MIPLYLTYISTGAEELRAKVYQPLFGEVSKLEGFASSDSIQTPPLGVYDDLVQKGELQRLPGTMRNQINTLYADYGALGRDVLAITGLLQRGMSKEIMTVRTESDDRAWNAAVARQLREESISVPGISSITQGQYTHAARGRGIDVRDPQHPIVAAPGGPTWTFEDWANYPASVAEIEKLWTAEDYLYFDATLDTWYYRITRSDLLRRGVTLEEFLRSTHTALESFPDFQRLGASRSRVIAGARATVESLAHRVHQPKELLDIFR